MASTKTLNAANLETLGAPRLAAVLLDLAVGDAQVKRRLRLELASAGGSAEVAAQVRKRLATIAKARSVIEWNKTRAVADDLAMQRRAILDHVAPSDPAEAFDLLWRLIALATPISDRCDYDPADIFDEIAAALEALPPLAIAARLSPDTLADRVFDLVSEDLQNRYDGLIALLAEAMGRSGLTHLQGRFEAFAASPPPLLPEVERRLIGYGRGGPIYAEDHNVRLHVRTARKALNAIADALGDADAFIARQPPETRTNPAVAADIAERLLRAGRAEEALAALDIAAATRRGGGYWETWDMMRIAVLEALGRIDDVQEMRWALFSESLNADQLRLYLKRLPDFDDYEAEQRAMAHAAGVANVHVALNFLIGWPDLPRAAALVLARGGEIDGNFYELLTTAAEALETRYPLAATLLLRAMIDFALTRARTKRYPHAARHLESCASYARRIEDFGAWPDHQTYVADLRAQHGRKTGFWQA
ncbi:hypothetical protein BH10PSE15_BH10PSE15_14470 [soil metagenome]